MIVYCVTATLSKIKKHRLPAIPVVLTVNQSQEVQLVFVRDGLDTFRNPIIVVDVSAATKFSYMDSGPQMTMEKKIVGRKSTKTAPTQLIQQVNVLHQMTVKIAAMDVAERYPQILVNASVKMSLLRM